MIQLNFNESPFNLKKDILREYTSRLESEDLNRYGSFRGENLIDKLASQLEIPSSCIAVGNGSDELLKIVTETFLNEGEKALTISPHFVVYPEYVELAGGEFISYYLNDDLTIDEKGFLDTIQKEKPALIYLCTPHNPTGIVLRDEFIEKVIEIAPNKVVIDEAYIEFSDTKSYIHRSAYDCKVIVARTFSKAYGIAGVRLGYVTTTPSNIKHINSRRLIFSLSTLSEIMGEVMLDYYGLNNSFIDYITSEKKRVLEEIVSPHIATFPSSGSFIFMKSSTDLYSYLGEHNIIISKVPWKDETTYRITIGSVEENSKVISLLNKIT